MADRPALKRMLDLAIAIPALALLGIPLCVVAVAVRLDSPGPALFRQLRVGQGERLFAIHKFRTMTMLPDGMQAGFNPGARSRITRLGSILRRTKIDELPQLIDVILGDMSLVGPRPEVPDWFYRYAPANRAVMAALKPGITDFATLRFANEEALLASAPDPEACYLRTIMPKKARYARFYARRSGFLTDLGILCATVAQLVGWSLRRSGRRRGQ